MKKFRRNVQAYLWYKDMSGRDLAIKICKSRGRYCYQADERAVRRLVSTGRKSVGIQEAEEIATVLGIPAGDLCFMEPPTFRQTYCVPVKVRDVIQ